VAAGGAGVDRCSADGEGLGVEVSEGGTGAGTGAALQPARAASVAEAARIRVVL